MPRVTHFEIAGENPEKLADFYKTVFGWNITKWDGPIPYWNIVTGKSNEPGIDGGMIKKQAASHKEVVNTINVPSVDLFLKKIKEKNGKILMPKKPVPGVGWLAYFKDPEGNVFGIIEEDKNAS